MQLSESTTLIDVYWFTQGKAPHSFGIVTVLDEITNERKAYVGVITGEAGEDEDIKAIYEHGAKVTPGFLESVKRDLGV